MRKKSPEIRHNTFPLLYLLRHDELTSVLIQIIPNWILIVQYNFIYYFSRNGQSEGTKRFYWTDLGNYLSTLLSWNIQIDLHVWILWNKIFHKLHYSSCIPSIRNSLGEVACQCSFLLTFLIICNHELIMKWWFKVEKSHWNLEKKKTDLSNLNEKANCSQLGFWE